MEKLLKELIELQKASIRLQKFAIVLMSETKADAAFAAHGGKPSKTQEAYAWRSVQQMRKTVERVAAGKGLLK